MNFNMIQKKSINLFTKKFRIHTITFEAENRAMIRKKNV